MRTHIEVNQGDMANSPWQRFGPVAGGCVNWEGKYHRQGYGYIYIKQGRTHFAHRAAYEAAYGEIPPGRVIHHKCGNRACINPDHLEMKSGRSAHQSEHMAKKKRKPTCGKGHKFTEENTLIKKTKRGYWRSCKTCHNLLMKRYYQRKMAKVNSL